MTVPPPVPPFATPRPQPPVRKPIPPQLPRVENLIEVPAAERACPVCGADHPASAIRRLTAVAGSREVQPIPPAALISVSGEAFVE